MTDIPIQFVLPMFMEHVQPRGQMPAIPQAHALWYFLGLAHRSLESVTEQVSFEGDTDVTVYLRQHADTISSLYQVTLEEMFNAELVSKARSEALASGIWIDSKIIAWIESGGRAYNEITRDPDALSKER